VLIRSDGAGFAWLVSQAGEQFSVTPRVASGLGLAPLDGTARDGTVTLDPFGVRVLRLTGML
jgi:hypothetical protein